MASLKNCSQQGLLKQILCNTSEVVCKAIDYWSLGYSFLGKHRHLRLLCNFINLSHGFVQKIFAVIFLKHFFKTKIYLSGCPRNFRPLNFNQIFDFLHTFCARQGCYRIRINENTFRLLVIFRRPEVLRQMLLTAGDFKISLSSSRN